jgi:hypothetical protein
MPTPGFWDEENYIHRGEKGYYDYSLECFMNIKDRMTKGRKK